MTIEYRGAVSEVRDINESDHTFAVDVVTYGTVDSYGSVWEPNVFSDSLRSKLPSSCWAHDHARIIGSMKEYDERGDKLSALIKFADFSDVPDARMAWSLLKDGHVKDTSFGFKRQDWTDTRRDGTATLDGEKERLRRARLDEVSPVLVGAVPGAGATAVRADGRVTQSDAARLLALVASGKIELRDALGALEARALMGEDGNAHAFVPKVGSPMICAVCGGTKDDPDHDGDDDTNDPNDLHDKPREDDEFELRADDEQIALDLMELDGERVDTNPGGEAKLKEYWAHGKGAAKLRWGTEGDHTRCVHELGKYVGPEVVHGLCTNIQKLAIGHAGNPTAAEKGRADPDVSSWLEEDADIDAALAAVNGD